MSFERKISRTLTHRKYFLLQKVNMFTAQKRKFALSLISGISKKDAEIKGGRSAHTVPFKGAQPANHLAPSLLLVSTRKN